MNHPPRTIVTTSHQLTQALTAAGVEDKEASRLIQHFPMPARVRTWREHAAQAFDARFLDAPLNEIPMSVVITGMGRELAQWHGLRDRGGAGAQPDTAPYCIPFHEMPPDDVLQAAKVLARWFSMRCIDKWELDACASRSPSADVVLVIARQEWKPPHLTRVDNDLYQVLRGWMDIDPAVELDVITVRTRGAAACSIENGRALLIAHEHDTGRARQPAAQP